MAVRTILFLAANPSDRDHLELEVEAKAIRTAVQRSGFSLEVRRAVTADELCSSLSTHRPSIVHFSGHGEAKGELYLEDEAGKSHAVDPGDLADLFSHFSDVVECVVLNACYSDRQAKAISKHVPHVIGTTIAIADKAAIRFSEIFYRSLGDGNRYDFSYSLASSQLTIEKLDTEFASTFHSLRKSQILEPIPGSTIPSGKCIASGIVGTEREKHLYVATGGKEDCLYWPSAKLEYGADGKWSGRIDVGHRNPTATISLLSVDDRTVDFIEFYRNRQKALDYTGVVLRKINILDVVDRVTINVDLMPLRDRLVGTYSLFRSDGMPTGETVDVALSGEWGVEMTCTLTGQPRWSSVVMIDDGNPNVGKGVYTLSDGKKGHHYITFHQSDPSLPSTKTITVDGYSLAGNCRWSKQYVLAHVATEI